MAPQPTLGTPSGELVVSCGVWEGKIFMTETKVRAPGGNPARIINARGTFPQLWVVTLILTVCI